MEMNIVVLGSNIQIPNLDEELLRRRRNLIEINIDSNTTSKILSLSPTAMPSLSPTPENDFIDVVFSSSEDDIRKNNSASNVYILEVYDNYNVK